MRDFNAVKFKLDLSKEIGLNVFSRLVCGLSFKLPLLPEMTEFKLEGRTPYAAIGDADQSKYSIVFNGETCSFLSCLEVRDNGFRGTVSNEWFEADLKEFKLFMPGYNSSELSVQINSFEHYDLLLDYVRNFGAKIIEKSFIKMDAHMENPLAEEAAQTIVEENDSADSELDKVEGVSALVKIGTVEIDECLGFELYQLIENKLMDFLAALGINQHHLLKDQSKYDENGWYQKSFNSRLLKLDLTLLLDRDSDAKNAELTAKVHLLFPHNYLPSAFEMKAFHTEPGNFKINTIELFTEANNASDELTKKLEGDLKTFFMIAVL